MTRFLSSCVAIVVFAGSLYAAEEELPFPSPSSFDASRISRDPFEALDEVKMSTEGPTVLKITGVAGEKENLAAFFRVTTISLGRYSLAVINQATFTQGETFKVDAGGKSMTVRVAAIEDGAVELDCGGRSVRVPIQVTMPVSLKEEDSK